MFDPETGCTPVQMVERLQRVIAERDEKLDEYLDHIDKCHRLLRELGDLMGQAERNQVSDLIATTADGV